MGISWHGLTPQQLVFHRLADIRRFNTFLALARDQDEELSIAKGEIRRLHLALLIMDNRQKANVSEFPADRIVRRFPSPSDGGDAA